MDRIAGKIIVSYCLDCLRSLINDNADLNSKCNIKMLNDIIQTLQNHATISAIFSDSLFKLVCLNNLSIKKYYITSVIASTKMTGVKHLNVHSVFYAIKLFLKKINIIPAQFFHHCNPSIQLMLCMLGNLSHTFLFLKVL